MRHTLEQCLTDTTGVNPVQKEDGTWALVGLGANRYMETTDILQRLIRSFNTSYYVSNSPEECYDRLVRNESDFSNTFFSIRIVSPAMRTMLPIFVEKVEFLSGYIITDGKWDMEETASVITNVYLLDFDVYLWALVLFVSLVLFVIARVVMFSVMRQEIWTKLKRKGVSPGYVIRRELSRVYYNSSDQFKWISLLLTMLVFYLVTSFLCVYKTSHVIIFKPFYPESYQQSLDWDTSYGYYYDKFHPVSGGFQDAPSDSLKGKIWSKSMTSDHNQLFNLSVANPAAIVYLLLRGTSHVMDSKSIYLASTVTMPILKTSSCAASPEDKLYLEYQFSDPSEEESIVGNLLGQAVPNQELVEKRIRHVFEAHLLPYHMKTVFDVFDEVGSMMGTSKSHQWRQKVTCENPNAFLPEAQVKPIPFSYFSTFFAACGLVWFIAFIIHFSQISRKKRSSVRQ